MPRTPVERIRRGFLALAAALGVGSLGYFLASGTRPGAPLVFAVGAALALAVSLYLVARSALAVVMEPQSDELQVATGRRRKELERDKQLVLKALKELAFDHEMRKISDTDYQTMSATYRARAMRVMRQLDEGAEAYRREIADELTTRRGARSEGATGPSPAPLASSVPAAATPVDARRACPRCATPNEGDAVFCKGCGARMVAEAAP